MANQNHIVYTLHGMNTLRTHITTAATFQRLTPPSISQCRRKCIRNLPKQSRSGNYSAGRSGFRTPSVFTIVDCCHHNVRGDDSIPPKLIAVLYCKLYACHKSGSSLIVVRPSLQTWSCRQAPSKFHIMREHLRLWRQCSGGRCYTVQGI